MTFAAAAFGTAACATGGAVGLLWLSLFPSSSQAGASDGSWWEDWLRSQSVPTVLLVALLYLLWRAGRFVAPELRRLVDGHLAFLRDTSRGIQDLGGRVHTAQTSIDDNTTSVQDLAREVRRLADGLTSGEPNP